MAASYSNEKLASAVDAWMESNFIMTWAKTRPAYDYLLRKKRIQMGGPGLVAPISHTADTTNIAPVTDFTANLTRMAATGEKARYTWVYYGGLVLVTHDEDQEIRDDSARVDLLENRLAQGVEQLAQELATDLFAKTTRSGGINSIYAHVTQSSSTIGGISVGGSWQGNVATSYHASAPVTNTTMWNVMSADFLTLENLGQRPDVIICSPTVFAKVESEFQSKYQFLPTPGQNRGEVGYPSYGFRGAEIINEPFMFEETGAVSGKVHGWYLMYSTRYNYFCADASKPLTKPADIPLGFAHGYKFIWGVQQPFFKLNDLLVRKFEVT